MEWPKPSLAPSKVTSCLIEREEGLGHSIDTGTHRFGALPGRCRHAVVHAVVREVGHQLVRIEVRPCGAELADDFGRFSHGSSAPGVQSSIRPQVSMRDRAFSMRFNHLQRDLERDDVPGEEQHG